jgi:hypothetical protein
VSASGLLPASVELVRGGLGLGRDHNMTYKMNEFTGIDQVQITKLQEASIETSDDMMRVWADKNNREALSEKTGINTEQFGQIASMARLARIKNVGPKHVDLLLAAGIDGPKSLFEFAPEGLMKRLAETKALKNLTAQVPQLTEIETWFVDGKPVVAITA